MKRVLDVVGAGCGRSDKKVLGSSIRMEERGKELQTVSSVHIIYVAYMISMRAQIISPNIVDGSI